MICGRDELRGGLYLADYRAEGDESHPFFSDFKSGIQHFRPCRVDDSGAEVKPKAASWLCGDVWGYCIGAASGQTEDLNSSFPFGGGHLVIVHMSAAEGKNPEICLDFAKNDEAADI